jgi:hypothetical protein
MPRTPDSFVLGELVVVVGGGVLAVVLGIGPRGGAAFGGDVATGGDVLLRRDGGEVVMVVPTTFVTFVTFVVVVTTFVAVVVVGVLAVAVGTVVVPLTWWKERVGGDWDSDFAKAHTAPLAASTATTSTMPGYQAPSR